MQEIFDYFKQKAEPLLAQLYELRHSTIFPLLFHPQTSIASWVISHIYDALSHLKSKIDGNIDVILFSSGGDADTAFHIGKMLHKMTNGTLSFIVTRRAASAATLLTFSGDKIFMGPPSELSPIDPQIEVSPYRFVSAATVKESALLFLREITKQPDLPKTTVEAFLEKLPIKELVDYDRLLEHVEELAIELLKLRMIKDESEAKEVANKFVRGFKYHGRSITIDDAIALGLSVEELPAVQWDCVWEFSKKWETVSQIPAEEGSQILPLTIGNGLAFIPSKKANEIEETSSLHAILKRL